MADKFWVREPLPIIPASLIERLTMAPVRSPRWHFSRKGLLDEMLMPTRCPAAVDAGICPDRGLDALMAEKLSDGFEFSRVRHRARPLRSGAETGAG